MSNIEYAQDRSDRAAMKAHFDSCDIDFVRVLSERVNLDQYIDKIFSKSVRYEAWSEDRLVGLLAVYNGHEFDFITNISVVKDFAKLGVASKLLNNYMPKTNREIKLEVARKNIPALNLYKKFGFEIKDENEKYFFLNFSPEA